MHGTESDYILFYKFHHYLCQKWTKNITHNETFYARLYYIVKFNTLLFQTNAKMVEYCFYI